MALHRDTHLDGLPLATALVLCAGLVLWIGRDGGVHAQPSGVFAGVPRESARLAVLDDAAPQTPFGTRSIGELLEDVLDPPLLRREVPPLEEGAPLEDDGPALDAPTPRWIVLQDRTGRALAEGRMVGERPDGPWLFRGSGGVRLAQGMFSAGVPDGPWQAWHEDGSQRETLEYDAGLPQGLRVEWWPNGVKALEGRYVDGERDGEWSTWHDSGALRSRGTYEDGLREGPWSEWHVDGSVRSTALYRAGRRDGPYRAWHACGAVAEAGEFVDGLREGPWGFFSPEGERERRSGVYVAGVRQRE